MVKIDKEVLKDGSIRWRARGVSTGKDPVTGKRTQRTITGRTRKAVEAEVKRIGVDVDNRTYRAPWDGLVPEVLDSYLANGTDDWEENTKVSYAGALQPASEYWAQRKARTLTREDVEDSRGVQSATYAPAAGAAAASPAPDSARDRSTSP